MDLVRCDFQTERVAAEQKRKIAEKKQAKGARDGQGQPPPCSQKNGVELFLSKLQKQRNEEE